MSANTSSAGSPNDPAIGNQHRSNRLPSLVTLFRERNFFPNVNDEAIGQLEAQMHTRTYSDKAILCKEGDAADWTFVVMQGEVEVIKTAVNGTMIQVNVLKPGEWGGIMGLLGQGPRMARLLARGDVMILAIEHSRLVQLMDQVPGLSAGLLTCMGSRIRDDAAHLLATLQYVRAIGLDNIAAHCSAHERLMLDTVRHRVAAAESLSEIMDFVFESIKQEGHCDRLTLVFLEDGGARLVSYWTRANYEPLILPADYQCDLVGSPLEKVLQRRGPTISHNLEEYARQHPDHWATRQKLREGLRTSIASPLVISGRSHSRRTIGFIIRSARKVGVYNAHEAMLHQAIADNIGPAVEKAYQIEQLTRANHDYSEVLGFISHELQSPIASIVTNDRLMLEGYLGELNEKQTDKLRRSVSKGEYLLGLIQDYLNLSQLEDVSLKAHFSDDVQLGHEVIEPALELIETELEAKQMRVDWISSDKQLQVRCDPRLIKIALTNLLRNAIKYGKENGEIRIRTSEVEQQFHIAVWNQGPGFSPSQRSKLFKKFSRIDDPALKKEKGTGIGLYMVWRIMQLHEGRVLAQSEQGKWAEFALCWPLESCECRVQSCLIN